LAKLQKVSDGYLATVLSDETLLDVEKQQIRENIVFRTNIYLTTIKYGEEVADVLFPETKGCNWWCKAKKAVKCAAPTIKAISTCVSAGIYTYASGVNPYVIGAWGKCLAAAIVAWNCWK
jgi:hypothetical protein